MTILKANPSPAWIIQGDGVIGVGNLGAPSVISFIPPKLRWKEQERKKRGSPTLCMHGLSQESQENHFLCSSHGPYQELRTIGSIPFALAGHSKKSYPHFMAGITCLLRCSEMLNCATVPQHRQQGGGTYTAPLKPSGKVLMDETACALPS